MYRTVIGLGIRNGGTVKLSGDPKLTLEDVIDEIKDIKAVPRFQKLPLWVEKQDDQGQWKFIPHSLWGRQTETH